MTQATPATNCKCGHAAADHTWSNLTNTYRCNIHAACVSANTTRYQHWCPCESYRWDDTQTTRRQMKGTTND